MSKAALLLLAMRLGLAGLGYERARKILALVNRSQQASRYEQAPDMDRILWALSAAGKIIARERGCLPLAMATQCWLDRCGVHSDLRIGVKRDESGKIEAHAWVEQGGRVLIGGSPSIDSYEVLPVVRQWT